MSGIRSPEPRRPAPPSAGAAGPPGGREQLLAAAVRLFAQKGYAATTVRDILRAAGVTAPVLYYHFGSKEGLFRALAEEGMRRFRAAHESALAAGGSATEMIRRLCLGHAAVRREYADLSWVVEAILSGPPEAAPRVDFRAMAGDSVARFEALVRQGIEAGEFRAVDPHHGALAILGTLEIAARRRLLGWQTAEVVPHLEAMLDVVLTGLAPVPLLPPPEKGTPQ